MSIFKTRIKDNITFFDLETTGLDTNTCKIVSIYAVNNRRKREIDTLVNPEIEITPELTAIHGTTNKDVKFKPVFTTIAQNIKDLFESSEYIAGYNICKYDVPLIKSMFSRHGSTIQLDNLKFIDLFHIVVNVLDEVDLNSLERRNLTSVYKLITGKELDAHKAKYDVLACIEILEELEKNKLPWRDHILTKDDVMGELVSDGNYILKTGKYRGKSVFELINLDKSYLRYMNSKGFVKLADNLLTIIS